jgi:acyl-CoA synthetase (AMP-forming)/AMP-acid ligase II/acyl carrier protein
LNIVLDEPARDAKVTSPLFSLPELLEHHARRVGDAPAVLAPDRAPLSYRRLHHRIEDVGRSLRAMGIGRQDRVAVMLPNGPDLAVAIICVASNAACAVVNAVYAAEELERYFAALRPRALITPAGAAGPARRVALAADIMVVELAAAGTEAGLFTLSADRAAEPSRDAIGPGGTAIMLLTSGTTSQPKIVPLTHTNICSSAQSSAAALVLRETDRCLNVLPLFHGHGLIATVLTSLVAGASVVCTPGCDVNRFFGWLTKFRPTWYSAVPTMHQAILARARQEVRQGGERIEDCRLRLVRSASAPLPPRVLAELERTFATSVIEFYGMTETASAPIACNPLPPLRRKPGSVGIAVGLEVAIINESGVALPHGQTGEVAVRGQSVMLGYDGDAAATRAAFAGTWFKTGDQGFFDTDGYLFLSGRTREMINRGGENIAPREVDEALLEHPAVAEAVTFSVPHPSLGEDVAAAIVLRPEAEATARDIRQFAALRLAEFKVPRQLLFVKELPKGPTGKVQRVGMATKLGLTDITETTFVSPRTPLENLLAGIWAQILQRERVSVDDDFFDLGGDSLLAAQVLTCIHETTQIEVPVASLFDAPTVAEMANYLEPYIKAGGARRSSSDIVRISRENALPASPAQVRLWKLQQALPDLPFFNVLHALRITSPVDASCLERSINAVVGRHEILRTTFDVIDGRHVQVIAPQLSVPLAFDDLHKFAKARQEAAGHKIIEKELLHSFDLARGPLIRTRLVRLAGTEHLLLIAMHQTVVDGWSLGVFVDELVTFYEADYDGKPLPIAPPALQYADFASWQRQWHSHPDIFAQLHYWRKQLRGPLPPLNFTTTRRRQIAATLYNAQREITLPKELTAAVKQFSHREGGTLFMALVAALKVLLHHYLSADDLRVATNVANRNRAGTENLIGPLANTVILRSNLGSDPTLQEVLRRIRATTLAAYANQDLPFEDLVETLTRERGLGPAEFCRVMILLHNAALRPVASSGRTLRLEEANPGMPQPLMTSSNFDVILVLREGSEGLVGSCIYKPHLFSIKSIDRLFRDYCNVLELMVTQPHRPISAIPIKNYN